uniref:Uncharacterized protein n=1 Tax=Oryza nivara TaxID=4536 RepID=A0A0E0GWY8_ORYNI
MGSSNTNANNSSGGGKDKDDKTSPSFKEGERVLAYHGPLLYEAKFRSTKSPNCLASNVQNRPGIVSLSAPPRRH